MMKDYKYDFEIEGKKYELIFDLNVLQDIQEEYGSIKRWGELTDGKSGETNIKALIYGFTKMLNEQIEINNENNGTNEPLYTEKQVGRIITKLGFSNATNVLNQAVVEGTKSDTPKNE